MFQRRSLLISCAVMAVVVPANAAELIVDWRAPDCAKESDFRARVQNALRRQPEQVLREDLRVSVEISENLQTADYDLRLSTEHGTRHLQTATCAEAVAAAAVVVSLAIDP